jgi:urease accessory protein
LGFGWLAYQQFLDSALPIGGFSHSFGLETLVQEGSIATLPELQAYVATILRHCWATSDTMAIRATYLYGPQERWPELWGVDRLLHVQRAAKESREGVQKMGNRLYKLARTMYPTLGWEPLQGALERRECPGSHALLHGWVAWRLDVPERQAAEGFLYASAVTCVNSALRLMSIGQTQGQKLLAELLPIVSEAWQDASKLDPYCAYTCVPAVDIAMMRHETLYSRLFMS